MKFIVPECIGKKLPVCADTATILTIVHSF